MRFERIRSGEEPRYGEAMALYQRSFPLFEQRYPQVQLAVMPQEEYHFTLLYEGEDFAGLLLYWEADSFCYVEHLCITESMRGKGCGSRALSLLREKGKKMILEIDPPVESVPAHPSALPHGVCGSPAGGDVLAGRFKRAGI